MGVASSLEAKAKDVLLAQRVLDLKQKKRERDTQQSLQIAATRDRLLWIGGYYSLLGLLAGARHIAGHRRGIHFTWDSFFLPLNQAIVCIPPFLFGYQVDYAYFGKGERISLEAECVRGGGLHRWFDCQWLPASDDTDRWFNQPLSLPLALKPTYDKLKAQSDSDLARAGLPPEPHWATFPLVPPPSR